MAQDLLPCPVCGFMVNDEGYYGTYNICPICNWEDDGVQLANPCSERGANGNSLAAEQAIWIDRIPLNITEREGFLRSKIWRPLTTSEIQTFKVERENRHWSNVAVVEEKEAYWYKK
jgi:Cysteine-rich CPCC